VRYGVSGALLVCVLAAGGCSDDEAVAEPPPVAESEAPVPAYDPALEPAAAVLALVPEDTAVLTVTDFEQVRLELGLGELTEASTPEEVATFWARATSERPLLTTGMLRPEERRLQRRYGVTQADVDWEAHLYDEADVEVGWVLGFRDGTDLARVAEASRAEGSVLSGADVDTAHGLVTSGTTDDPTQSWAADADLLARVSPPASATYVARGCLPDRGGVDLDELDTYALQFEGTIMTARLGEGRRDLFIRMRMAADETDFASVFEGGVADPGTGRIGYRMTDPAAAARLALEHRLPFAACA
jgi:hypothetical protein